MEVANYMRQKTAATQMHPGLSKDSSTYPLSSQNPVLNLEMNSSYDYSDAARHEENRSGNSW